MNRLVGAASPPRPGVLLFLLLAAWTPLLPAIGAEPPLRDWKFIVIHHSATTNGSAEAFDEQHRARGMVNGLAYHFVIDNGTDGTTDGAVETGTRWTKQLPGGHCRQNNINEHGIGICLVGDFSKSRPTEKQLDALESLVRQLQEQFDIAADQILGHGEIIGEFSECPGKEFPWDEFKKRLKK
jgi:N-acetyl-anhydromuramyl-L-alanine amidase AmpD